MTHTLKLTTANLTEALFRGLFRPFDKYDWMAYADAEEGSLIATITVDNTVYEVIFTPTEGEFDVFLSDYEENTVAWKVDPLNGEVIRL